MSGYQKVISVVGSSQINQIFTKLHGFCVKALSMTAEILVCVSRTHAKDETHMRNTLFFFLQNRILIITNHLVF